MRSERVWACHAAGVDGVGAAAVLVDVAARSRARAKQGLLELGILDHDPRVLGFGLSAGLLRLALDVVDPASAGPVLKGELQVGDDHVTVHVHHA